MSVQPERPTPGEAVVTGLASPECCGTFRYFIEGNRWEWSDAVARMHGYEPGTVVPTAELLLRHIHPEDRQRVAGVARVTRGEIFSSRHRIIDAAQRTHTVVVVGDSMVDETGTLIGTSGFFVDVSRQLQSDISTAIFGVTESRACIEQAKGVLMASYGITAQRAFEILVWRSQQTNIKVRGLAERLLAAIAGNALPDTTPVDQALLTLRPPTSRRAP